MRLRAPAGVGAVQLLSGVHRNVAADGTVEMSESDAAPLPRAGSGSTLAACRDRKRRIYLVLAASLLRPRRTK